jgi:arabinogalactan oligomer/maltooligosaccharide transport system permease protein
MLMRMLMRMLVRMLVRMLALFSVLLASTHARAADTVRLWHSYRGAERNALEELAKEWERRERVVIELLAVPNDAFGSKLAAAIPLGEGPDLFIDAHERLGDFLERGIVAAVEDLDDAFEPTALDAVRLDGRAYGIPLSPKCVALYYRTDLVDHPPDTFEGMRAALRAPLAQGSFLLAYETRFAYAHAAILHAFGGRLLTADDHFGFVGPEAEASLALLYRMSEAGEVPRDADGALVTALFRSGKAAFAINGPWLASDLANAEVPYRVAVLPKLEATGEPLRPLLTVEALMFSPNGAKKDAARAFARFLSGKEAAELRQRVARTVSVRRDVLIPEDDHFLRAFSEQAKVAVPMPTSVAMRAVWEPAEKAMRKVLYGTLAPREALHEAERRFEDVRRPLPPPASPTPALVLLGLGCLLGAFVLVRRARSAGWRARLKESLPAYAYVVHAVVAVGVLVILPLLAGAAISLFAGRPGSLHYVGIANFMSILSARGGPLFESGSFYLVLVVTLAWTAVNIFFHLSIGMFVGVLLSRPTLRFKALYRVLLIVPWAVPNYVTALAWKGMFHRQFGAVNALTQSAASLFGVELEPIAWFSRFSTAFTANVATNVWLGFPFMMVVTLAALTAVPRDVLEAAEVDGAGRLQRFFMVTLPIIRPAMLPAALLGAIWTFNMFNVVFLVSGGEPDGQTDILVSEAYRWAFTRQAQYGYAAAYAVLIFALLFGATRLIDRFRRPVREAPA